MRKAPIPLQSLTLMPPKGHFAWISEGGMGESRAHQQQAGKVGGSQVQRWPRGGKTRAHCRAWDVKLGHEACSTADTVQARL